MSNPLLADHPLPPFGDIEPGHIEPAIDQLLAENRAAVEQLLAEQPDPPTWDSLVAPLEALEDRLSRAWSPVGHLNAVVNSDALRQAYNACLPKLSAYASELGQHRGLFEAFQALANSPEFADLNQAQRQAVSNALRDFRLAGVDLPEAQQNRYRAIKQRLSALSSQFADNLMDATQAWHYQITDDAELAGLPDSARAMFRAAAEARDLDGWVVTLEMPAYIAVLTHADNRDLRERVYTAYTTRASDQGPNAGQHDNGPLMAEILALRHELAQLLGFNHYAEYSLATKMADTPAEVFQFLDDLVDRGRPQAQRELVELQAFAEDTLGLTDVQAWDLTWAAEKLRQAKYAVSQEELRPYFPAEKVIDGLFRITGTLFDIHFERDESIATWHPDVRVYNLKRDGEVFARFYFDLYARSNKRGGAWMDECRVRRREGDAVQLPVAYLTCNFTPAYDGKPSLLTHDEVTTLFHEFGHGLHHMLTQVDVAAVSGINGVAWDAVELPSQFLENWCWEPEAIPLISGHHETGEPLPSALLEKLLAAKTFQSAMMLVRQLEFSLFDFHLHADYDPAEPATPHQVLQSVRERVAVVTPPAFNRFENGFAHIFAGGYAAGYYSYKWAEVLSADAFSLFEENGVFDTATGRRFREVILERGGSAPPAELFAEFRGRPPEVAALLRHSGIVHDQERAVIE